MNRLGLYTLFVVVIVFSCKTQETINGVYAAKPGYGFRSEIYVMDSIKRFVFLEVFANMGTSTSGFYRLENNNIILTTDDLPHYESYLEFGEEKSAFSEVMIEILIEDFLGQRTAFEGTIEVQYVNGETTRFSSNERINIEEARTLKIGLLGTLPINVLIDSLKSDFIKAIMVEDSRGNLRFEKKRYKLRNKRLINSEGEVYYLQEHW